MKKECDKPEKQNNRAHKMKGTENMTWQKLERLRRRMGIFIGIGAMEQASESYD